MEAEKYNVASRKGKYIRRAAGKKRLSKKKVKAKLKKAAAIFIVLPIVIFSAAITLNERFFKSEYLPSWFELYSCAGINNYSGNVSQGDFGIASLEENDVCVYFFDVGQGDSALILTSEEKILIDCGEKEYYGTVYNCLKDLGVDTLDFAVITHPHSDHAGGMADVIKDFTPDYLLMPNLSEESVPTSKFYRETLEAADKHGSELSEITADSPDIILSNGAEIEFIAPVKEYSDLNNSSIVFRLVHGETSFLFMGDAEEKAEKDILNSGANVSSDILKAGHHGSDTSSSPEFLEESGGQAAVISVGSPNSYGHPSADTLDNFNEKGYNTILRTDKRGNIGFISDGKTLRYRTDRDS